ncbi:MAG: four helix bundle protein [Phycisphaerae bacterium]
MSESKRDRYDLEDRTLAFAREVRAFVKTLMPTPANQEDCRQLIRASGSVGANYIETNEALGRKDFLMRIRISRKEAKECGYWLRLLDLADDDTAERTRCSLVRESQELTSIFGAILRNSQARSANRQ